MAAAVVVQLLLLAKRLDEMVAIEARRPSHRENLKLKRPAPMTTRDRLFGWRHAFDHPVTVWITGTVFTLLFITPPLIWALAKAGVITPSHRQELLERARSWSILAPLMIGPVLLGAAWTISAVCILSLFCYREYARATGLFARPHLSYRCG